MVKALEKMASRERWLRICTPLIPAIFLVAVSVFVLIVTDFGKLFLIGDDAALVTASIRDPFSSWFLKGFSNYFLVFPEWTTPFTNFVRPIDNIILHLESLFFGRWYEGYFLAYYLAAGATSWLIYRLCLQNRVPVSIATLAAMLCVMSPAVIGPGLIAIAFTFDVICGFFVILALFFQLQGRMVLSIAALLAGVLTKETALYAPIAAALSVLFLKQKRWWAPFMLVPILCLGALRFLAFGSISGGIYAFDAGASLERLKLVVKGFLTWPGGIWIQHIGAFEETPLVFALFAGNIILWLYLALSILPWLTRPRSFVSAFGLPHEGVRATLLVWLLFGLGYCVCLGADGRFGGSVLPLLYLYMALQFAEKESGAPSHTQHFMRWREYLLKSRYSRVLLVAILILFGLVQATYNFTDGLPSHPEQRRALAFREALRNLSPTLARANVVYVANAPLSYSRPDSVASYLGLPIHLIYITEVSGCVTSNEIHGDGITANNAGLVTILLPSCAHFELPGVDREHMRKLTQGGGLGSTTGTYNFAKGDIISGRMGSSRIELGKQLDWHPILDKGAIFLSYSWNSGTYVSRPLPGAAN